MDLDPKSPATSTSEKYQATCTMYVKAEDVPPRSPCPTDGNSSEMTVAATSSKEAKHSASDDTYICTLFAKAMDVPPRPPLPTTATTEEKTVSTVRTVTPNNRNSKFHARLSFYRPSLWPNGSRIRVRFYGGTPYLWARIEAYAMWWSAYGNITFSFIHSGPSDVRITFDNNDGTWSLLGTQCLDRTEDQATMNLNFTPSTSNDRIREVVLHEFGHVLGAIHEHQSPLAQTPWNREVVYDYYKNLGNSNEWVDRNVFNQPFPEYQIDADYDTGSIMVYSYPSSFTMNGSSVGWIHELSARDYWRIAMIYPRNRYVVSSFTTKRPIKTPMEWENITFGISPEQPDPPLVAATLSMIDMSNRDNNIRVRTEVTDVQTDSYTIGLGTQGNRILYNSGVSLLRVPADDPNFRMGTITKAGPNSYSITFTPPFPPEVTPNVFAAFSGIDCGDNWRGALDIHKTTCAGFDLQVSTWGSSNLYSTSVQWIAYPSDLPGVEMGTFSGSGGAVGHYPLKNTFYSTPAVFTGFQRFDISPQENARLRIRATAHDPNRVDWMIETWADTVIYSVVGVFLAISS
ncbi:Metalloprotease [Xylaria cf. heliscus]|nr:Metalloprotease [Xylaria cf. heliscus]